MLKEKHNRSNPGNYEVNSLILNRIHRAMHRIALLSEYGLYTSG